MKQILLLQGKALLVELPEGAPKLYVINTGQPYLSYLDIDVDLPEVDLPPGNWRIIGMLSEVTEDGLASVVGRKFDDFQVCQKLNQQPQYDMFWVRYPSGECKYFDTKDECYLHALKMKLESSILAEGYYFSNPLGEEKEYKKSYTGHDMFFANHMVKYYEAQSRVLDRSRCLLLGGGYRGIGN